MYKQFKKELETKVEELNLKDQKICDRLKKCWQSIDELCSDHNDEDIAKKHQEKPVNIGGWRTVRLFVSSTFTDFYHEREILVKQVFPELREWCESRRIQLIDCDLRWGIPRDTTTGETIAVCLEEIDACHETNSGQPFFLNMTCDRYGWVPEDEDIPEEIKEKYDWVSDTSITFMEVLHGALRRRNQSAFFCLRNNDFISQLPKEHLARFRDADIYSQEQLKIIREKLYERFPEQIFEYSVKYGGIKKVDTDQKMVIIEGLQMFASKVTQYFKSAIEKRYPTPEFQQDISSEEMERDNQWAFVTERAATMIGREEEIEKLLQFAQGMEKNLQISEKYQPYSRKIEGWQIESSDNKLCVVEARSGWGKTSLLAKLTRTLVLEGYAVFYHFCGSTNLSKQPENLVQRLIHFLKKQSRECGKDSKDNKEEEKSPHIILQETFKDTRKVQKNLTIVIDAVNELTCMDMTNHLSWLPPYTPCNVKIIVSSNQHTPSLSHLAEHPCYWLKLSHLDESNLKQLAINYLRTFNKRLDSEQLDLLINGTGADNPLWVRLMCEELRVFGDFRHLTHKILQFPKSLDDLFSLIFSRLLAEDSTGCIKKVLCLIAISYSGLPCADILKILGDVVKDDTILLPRLHWAQARRHLKPYIRTIGYPNDLLTFSHESIWKAVEKILLTNKSEVVRLHVNLADYFQNICEHHELRSRCVPYHLSLGNLGKRMIDFLYTDVDAARLPDIMRSDYLQAFRCQYFASSQIPNTKEVKFCAFCSNRRCKMKSGSFAYVNKDCCIICGARILHNFSSSIGRTCTFHSVGPLNSTKCFSCSNYIWEKQYDTGNSGVKGYLCHSCGFGHKSNFCSILAPRS